MPMPSKFQSVVAVFDLLQRTLNVWKRHATKQSELPGMLLHQLCAIIVARSHRGSSSLGAGVEDIAHLGHRENGDTDAELLHLRESLLRRPGSSASSTACARPQAGRLMMMVVHIDCSAANVHLVHFFLGERAASAQDRCRTRCAQTFQNFSPGRSRIDCHSQPFGSDERGLKPATTFGG